jgi:hypothetical protein
MDHEQGQVGAVEHVATAEKRATPAAPSETMQMFYFVGDEEWTAERLARLPAVDAIIRLSRELAQLPTVDAVLSCSRRLDDGVVEAFHFAGGIDEVRVRAVELRGGRREEGRAPYCAWFGNMRSKIAGSVRERKKAIWRSE